MRTSGQIEIPIFHGEICQDSFCKADKWKTGANLMSVNTRNDFIFMPAFIAQLMCAVMQVD